MTNSHKQKLVEELKKYKEQRRELELYITYATTKYWLWKQVYNLIKQYTFSLMADIRFRIDRCVKRYNRLLELQSELKTITEQYINNVIQLNILEEEIRKRKAELDEIVTYDKLEKSLKVWEQL